MRTQAQFDRQPGSVIVNVKPPAAHVASVNQAFQDWQPVASQIISDVQTETPEAVSTPTTRQQPVSTPTTARQNLQSLLSEVNAIMQITPRVNTEKIRGFHYGDAVVSPKTNPDSPLMAYWERERQRKSDAVMAYQRKRAVC